MFNTDPSASHAFSVPLAAQLGITGTVNVTDLWSGHSLGAVTGTYTAAVPPGGSTRSSP